MDIANIVLEALVNDERFVQKVIPYLKEEYFEDEYQQILFRVTANFINKHQKLPNAATILVDIENATGVTDDIYNKIYEVVSDWDPEFCQELPWMLENTEEWCKDRAFYLAVKEAVSQLDGKKKKGRGNLPEIMSDALGVSFDTNIGHDYFKDWEARWLYYTDEAEKIPFDIDLLNEMTNGGSEKKTLNVVMGGIHTGKTRFLCHLAAAYASDGLNVIYFTMEMAENKIAHRIDANLLGINMDAFKHLTKDNFKGSLDRIKKTIKGEVIVKEFPIASAHAGHFRHVIKELKLKKDFDIDVIIVDYINICASSRAKAGTDTYTFIKMVAEELRGLGQEFNVPMWSATQTNRAAWGSSDIDMDDVAESWGLPATCDWLGAIIVDDALDQLQQFVIKQLKSRYSDKNKLPKGLINYSNETMRMSNAPNAGHLKAPSENFQNTGQKPKFDNFKI